MRASGASASARSYNGRQKIGLIAERLVPLHKLVCPLGTTFHGWQVLRPFQKRLTRLAAPEEAGRGPPMTA
jgi:hypothetical protein